MTTAALTLCLSLALPSQGLFNRPAQQHNKFGSGRTPMQREGNTQFSGEGVYSPQYGSLNPANGAGAPPPSAVGGGVPGAMTPYLLGQAGTPKSKLPAPFYTFGPNPAPAEAVGGMVVRGQLPAAPLPGQLPPGVIVSNQPYIRYQTPGSAMTAGQSQSVSMQPGPAGFAPMPAGQAAPAASLPMTSQATVYDPAINGYRPASQPVAPVIPPGWAQSGVGAGPYPGSPGFAGAGQVVGTLGPNTINPAATPGPTVLPGDLSWGQPRTIQLPPGVVVGSNLPLSAVSGRTTGSVFIATAPPPGVGGGPGGPAPAGLPGTRVAASAEPINDSSFRPAGTLLSEEDQAGRVPRGMAVDARNKVPERPPEHSADAREAITGRGDTRSPGPDGNREPALSPDVPPLADPAPRGLEAGRTGLGRQPVDGEPNRLKRLTPQEPGDSGEPPALRRPGAGELKPPAKGAIGGEELLPLDDDAKPPASKTGKSGSSALGAGELTPPGKSDRTGAGRPDDGTPAAPKAVLKRAELPLPAKDKPAPSKQEFGDPDEEISAPPPPARIPRGT